MLTAMNGKAEASAEQVQVVLRIRPLLGKERPLEVSGTAATHSANSPRHTLAVSDDQRQLLLGTDKRFHFDRIYQPLATQSELYDNSVRPLLDRCFAEKVHGTVFAYGQTGSGKTHTMGDGASTISSGDDMEGVIPRAIRQLFDAVETASTNDDVRVHVRVSFLEIYQEEVYDLLKEDTAAHKEVFIREDRRGRLIVSGVRELAATSAQEAMDILTMGSRNRTTGKTNVHEYSSRSHAIFTLTVEQFTKVMKNDYTIQHRRQRFKINLVDLAGSERLKKTKLQTHGVRFKESVKINSGLLALGNVIRALVDKQESDSKPLPQFSHQHVPYRQSKLTRFLQDGLGGNGLTLMIACASPAFLDFDETMNTVWYASRARHIRNTPTSGKVVFREVRLRPPTALEVEDEDEGEDLVTVMDEDDINDGESDDDLLAEEEEDEEDDATAEITDQQLIHDMNTMSQQEWIGKYIATLRQRTIKALNASTALERLRQDNHSLHESLGALEGKLHAAYDHIEQLNTDRSKMATRQELNNDRTVDAHLKDEAVVQFAAYLRLVADMVVSRKASMLDDVEVAREQALAAAQDAFPDECLEVFEWMDKILGSLESSSIGGSLLSVRGGADAMTTAIAQPTTFDTTTSRNDIVDREVISAMEETRRTGPLFSSDQKPSAIGDELESDDVSSAADEEEESGDSDQASVASRAPSSVASLRRRLTSTTKILDDLRLAQVEQDVELERMHGMLKHITDERDELMDRLDVQDEHLAAFTSVKEEVKALKERNSVLEVEMEAMQRREKERASVLHNDVSCQADENCLITDLLKELIPSESLASLKDTTNPATIAEFIKSHLAQSEVSAPPKANDGIDALEKDNLYYRIKNRELKAKLREFVAVHQKQNALLTKAQSIITGLRAQQGMGENARAGGSIRTDAATSNVM